MNGADLIAIFPRLFHVTDGGAFKDAKGGHAINESTFRGNDTADT